MNLMEIEGGAHRVKREVMQFREVVHDCNLQDFGYVG